MTDFSEDLIEQVWQKAQIVPNNNPDIFRKDYAGAWIRRDLYGQRNAKYGWEVDYCKPISKGGTDELRNLYPLHWKNKQEKGNSYPKWNTILTSDGVNNVEKVKSWFIQG